MEEYFDWLCHFVGCRTHRKLLRCLHSIDFVYIYPMDGNRFEDGVNLRYRFADERGHHYRYISGWIDDRDCSVLEMMIALCLRLEENIVGNDDYGDRTYKWFCDMLRSMGIWNQNDISFDEVPVHQAVERMMNHAYDKDGCGGLFYIPKTKKDMRKAEIWYQAMWYLNDKLGPITI